MRINSVKYKKLRYHGRKLAYAFSEDSFDIIVSNPPYIDKTSDMIGDNVREFEPSYALFADNSGLSYIKEIIVSSKMSLKNNGYLFIENGFDQSEKLDAFWTNTILKTLKFY